MWEMPFISPGRRKQTPVKLRTVLHIIKQRHLTGGVHRLPHMLVHKGRDESRKLQLHLRAVFHEVLVRVALQSLDGLVGATQLHAQHLAAMKQVAVLIGNRSCRSQITCRISTLGLETNRRWFV